MSFEGSGHDRFTEWLRERSEPEWTGATEHRFVRELAEGTLPDDAFRRYLLEDYAFVESLAGLVGHAAGHAPTMDGKRRLAGFLSTLSDEENDYFERSFDALGVSGMNRRDRDPAPVTAAFEDHLARAALEGYEEALAVLVPAEWIYLSWATDAADASPGPFYLEEWIDLHTGPEFEAFVGWLRGELDRHGADLSPRRERRIERRFRRTVTLEVAFFDTAYGRDDG